MFQIKLNFNIFIAFVQLRLISVKDKEKDDQVCISEGFLNINMNSLLVWVVFAFCTGYRKHLPKIVFARYYNNHVNVGNTQTLFNKMVPEFKKIVSRC